MPCPQDAELAQRGIQIDKFSVPQGNEVVAFMLTHAHTDHMRDLKGSFGERRPNAKIFCTEVTAQLAIISIKGLDKSYFRVVELYQPFHTAPGVTAWAFPAYHCDGSCMFLFEIDGRTRVLYTGDFRWNPEIRKNDLLMSFTIDRMYYDDFFDEITDEFPTFEQSYKDLRKHVVDLFDAGNCEKICINVSVLGVEPLLRELADELGIQYSLSKSLRDTWRGRQLEYLLDCRLICGETKFMLGVVKFDDEDDTRQPWVIPTCTYFLCGDEHKQKKPPHHSYVKFCTHANNKENTHLKILVAAKQVNPCGEAVGKLTCQGSV